MPEKKIYADIIIDITNEKLDKIFQYTVPKELEGKLAVGTEVLVPFGKGNKETRGYIVGFSETPGYDPAKIKEILAVPGESVGIETRLVALAAWMKESYGGTMIQALKTVLPIKRKEREREKKTLVLLVSPEEGEKRLRWYQKKNQKARARLLEALLSSPRLDYDLAREKLNITRPVVRALEEAGLLGTESSRVYRNPVQAGGEEGRQIAYTPEQ